MSHSAAILPSVRGVGTPSSWIAEGESGRTLLRMDVEAGSELVRGIRGMRRCPSITSWFGTNEALPCRKVWVSLDSQGTSLPQLSCGCSGREEKEKQLFREAAGSAAHPLCP